MMWVGKTGTDGFRMWHIRMGSRPFTEHSGISADVAKEGCRADLVGSAGAVLHAVVMNSVLDRGVEEGRITLSLRQ